MMSVESSPVDPASEPFPEPVADLNMDEEASYRRAMPLARLVSGGMRADDAHALHAFSESQVGWIAGARWLAARNARIALQATGDVTACAFHRYAAAAFRFGQCAVAVDNAEKKKLYESAVLHFGEAVQRGVRPAERHEIAWAGKHLAGWLIRPKECAGAPVTIIFGGFDGWREEYHDCAIALAERGVAAYLADLPGQGEARLRHGLFLDENYVDALGAIADHLDKLPELGGAIGLWGNSLGGYLAACAAGSDPRFAALCVNGGSASPLELPERHPRFWPKVEALTGTTARDKIERILAPLASSWLAERLRCPLLQLHGRPDAVFLLENGRVIHDGAGSADKHLLIWEDGDHCLYNHAEERNAVVADFFANRLR